MVLLLERRQGDNEEGEAKVVVMWGCVCEVSDSYCGGDQGEGVCEATSEGVGRGF